MIVFLCTNKLLLISTPLTSNLLFILVSTCTNKLLLISTPLTSNLLFILVSTCTNKLLLISTPLTSNLFFISVLLSITTFFSTLIKQALNDVSLPIPVVFFTESINISPLNLDFVFTSNSLTSTKSLNSARLLICNLKFPVILPSTYNVFPKETSPYVNNSLEIVKFLHISRCVKLASLNNINASAPTFTNLDPSP